MIDVAACPPRSTIHGAPSSRRWPTRRDVPCWSALAAGEATVNELAAPFEMSLPAVSRHIKVPERAGLVTQGQRAQYRPCAIDPTPLREVATWAERYRPIWEGRFDRLACHLDELDQLDDADAETDDTDTGDFTDNSTDQKDHT